MDLLLIRCTSFNGKPVLKLKKKKQPKIFLYAPLIEMIKFVLK